MLNAVDYLDCPCSIFNNPLKGFKNFTVLLTGESEETSFFVHELKKIGKIKEFSLSDPKGINFEGMGTGARLLFSVTDLNVLGEEDSKVMRISLRLSSSVDVLWTKNSLSDSYIWDTNIFATNEQVKEAISQVSKQLSAYLQEANPSEKPLFYVYF